MELGATVCAPQSYTLPKQLEPFFMVHQIAHELACGADSSATARSGAKTHRADLAKLVGSSAKGCPVCHTGMEEVISGLQMGEQHPVALFPCKKPCKDTVYATLVVGVLRQLRRDAETGREDYWYLMTRRPSAEQLAAADAADAAAATAATAAPRKSPAGSTPKTQPKKKSSALLAGQWEFPNVVVTDAPPPAAKPKSSAKQLQLQTTNSPKRGQKRKVGTDETVSDAVSPSGTTDGDEHLDKTSCVARARALTAKLVDLCHHDPKQLTGAACSDLAAAGHRAAEASRLQRRQLSAPVVHVFSTITHTMYIEVAELPPTIASTSTSATSASQERWQTVSPTGSLEREMAWMSEVAMAAVGMTANMSKVLAKAKNAY